MEIQRRIHHPNDSIQKNTFEYQNVNLYKTISDYRVEVA